MDDQPQNPTTGPQPPPPADPPKGDDGGGSKGKPALFEPPADVADDDATGYAVYDTTLGRFQGQVKRGGKPSKSDVAKVLPKGHQHAIVQV